LVFIKKNNQTEFFKKNRNRTETGSNRPVSVRFGFLEQKLVQTGLARFCFGLARVFSGFFGSGLVQFGSVFLVPDLKNQNRTEPVNFFKILIRLINFFSQFNFFNFLNLIDFLIFLYTLLFTICLG
jgi:hypothetical protein